MRPFKATTSRQQRFSSVRLIRSDVLSYNRDHTTREDNNKKRTAFDYYWLPGRAEQRPFDSVVLFDLVLRGAPSLLRSQSKVMADVFGVERDYWVCAVHQHDRCWWREGEAGFLADLSTFPDAVLRFELFSPGEGQGICAHFLTTTRRDHPRPGLMRRSVRDRTAAEAKHTSECRLIEGNGVAAGDRTLHLDIMNPIGVTHTSPRAWASVPPASCFRTSATLGNKTNKKVRPLSSACGGEG